MGASLFFSLKNVNARICHEKAPTLAGAALTSELMTWGVKGGKVLNH
jgi:hypothetical protein